MDTNYVSPNEEVRKARRKKSAEFFTPDCIVNKMCDKISPEDWADPDKLFLEPSFGNGNFLIEMLTRRIKAGVPWEQALRTLYGVELMEDNVAEAKSRLLLLLDDLVDYDVDLARSIMDKNLVCSDFFKWNFSEWRPYTDDELKMIAKNKKK